VGYRPGLNPQRILLYGVTGSGKSTLAAAISARTGIPWHSVDELTWEPGWRGVPDAEQRRRISAICAGDRWILDTAYSSLLDVVLPRVELIVGLDYPRWLSLCRLLRRTAIRLVRRQRVCNGNVETLKKTISRDSIIVWHFRSFRRKRDRMRAWRAAATGPPLVLFRSPRQARQWLGSLPIPT